MQRLSNYDLGFLPRPGDGACFYWSAGTGMGYYNATSFKLGAGDVDVSPIGFPTLQNAAALLLQMRSDRNAVADWILAPENRYTMRQEYDFWNNYNAMRGYRATRSMNGLKSVAESVTLLHFLQHMSVTARSIIEAHGLDGGNPPTRAGPGGFAQLSGILDEKGKSSQKES